MPPEVTNGQRDALPEPGRSSTGFILFASQTIRPCSALRAETLLYQSTEVNSDAFSADKTAQQKCTSHAAQQSGAQKPSDCASQSPQPLVPTVRQEYQGSRVRNPFRDKQPVNDLPNFLSVFFPHHEISNNRT